MSLSAAVTPVPDPDTCRKAQALLDRVFDYEQDRGDPRRADQWREALTALLRPLGDQVMLMVYSKASSSPWGRLPTEVNMHLPFHPPRFTHRTLFLVILIADI